MDTCASQHITPNKD
jgi:hypothetical protein